VYKRQEQQQQLVKRDSNDPEAYRLYLMGHFYRSKGNYESVRKALDYFQQAIARDPDFAAAHVGVARCSLWLGGYAVIPSGEAMRLAETALARSLEIDDSLPEAHAFLAELLDKQWRWREKEKELRRAISLNRNYAEAHKMLGNHLFYFRRFDEAMKELKLAQELDPLSPGSISYVSMTYRFLNHFDSSIRESKMLLNSIPATL
jgi:tetratricopeptide (TPR) repeat protein